MEVARADIELWRTHASASESLHSERKARPSVLADRHTVVQDHVGQKARQGSVPGGGDFFDAKLARVDVAEQAAWALDHQAIRIELNLDLRTKRMGGIVPVQ